VRDLAHAVAVVLQADAMAVVFDFVAPLGTRWDRLGGDRDAKIKSLTHGPKIGFRMQIANRLPVT